MNILKLGQAFLRSKFLGKPFYGHYYVTRRCNLRCPMCAIYRAGNSAEELPVEGINVIAENLKRIGLGIIVLTGGEPFLRADLPAIVRAFAGRGMLTRVQTNGLLVTEPALAACFANGLEYLTVSLDSARADVFDKICGHPGLWEKAAAAIRLAVRLKARSMTIVNTVVSKYNIEELPAIARLVDSWKAFASFVPVHINGADADNPIRSREAGMLFTDADKPAIEKSYGELIRLKKAGLRIGCSLRYLEDSLRYLLDGNARWGCDAGRLYLAVFPDGSIAPCDESAGIGTNRGSGLARVFASPAFKQESARCKNNCGGCIWGCWREASYLLNDWRIIGERAATLIKGIFPSS